MRCERLALAALLAAFALPQAPAADACGPDFPIELLSDRPFTMADLPEGVFLDEVATLVPPPGRYAIAIGDGGFAPAHARGGEVALYARGARAYHAGDRDGARAAFEQILALPEAARRLRSIPAAYMLGRIDPMSRGDAYFAMVRTLADHGFPDELGLAAASFGEQALQHEYPERIRLYAQQAALGHPSGGTSLLLTIREIIRGRREAEILGDPLGQRLLSIYLYTRDDELSDGERARLWRRMIALPHPAGADRLAAAAYRAGRWDDAARLVDGADDSAVGRWVRAKLALRAGDHAAAERYLHAAADAYAASPPTSQLPYDASTDYASGPRVQGERAILALADGRYPDAMAAAWAARSIYRDAAFIAERVLTLGELGAFVDGLPPDDDTGVTLTTDGLRALYGRRLMRAAHYQLALRYLPPVHRPAAFVYGGLMEAALASRDRIDAARALHLAGRIARTDGMEILGTEHAPDWAMWGGDYELEPTDEPIGAWLGATEMARVTASAPAFPQRFHYRFLASRLGEEAADHLPTKSQAFVATLCWSARHVMSRDPDRGRRLYRRYVRSGPAVFDMDFGATCPDPEFDRARRFVTPLRPGRAPWHDALPWLALAAIVAAFAAIHGRGIGVSQVSSTSVRS